MRNQLLISCVIAFSISGLAQKKAEIKPIQPIMQEFYNLTTQLNPYLVNEDRFVNPKNEEELKKLLLEFKNKTIELKKNKLSQNDDMKYRVLQLTETVTDAESSFREGFKNYSYWALKASLNNCYSCHTDKSLPSTSLVALAEQKTTDFQNAEFLFLVRNYKESIPLFEKLIKEFPKNKITEKQLDESLKKIVFYLVRTEENDEKTLKTFDMILKNRKLPEENRRQFLAWEKYVKSKKQSTSLDYKSITDEVSLKQWVAHRDNLASSYGPASRRYFIDLETNHILFKLIESNPSKDLKPWLLLYSADMQKYYRASMFDMTSELYLTECIESYPQSAAAQRCLDLFKEIKVESFTGSSGTHIPKSTYDQIKKFEQLIKKSQNQK